MTGSFLRPRSALAAAVLLVAGTAPALAADGQRLTIELTSPGGEGELMVALFDDPTRWLRTPREGARRPLPPAGEPLRVEFSGLPDTPVAVSVFIDRNGNGRLDSNALGIPIEPFAFSNDAAGSFGPPRFEQAAVDPRTTAHIRIQLP
ncbi:DUF2141 domain-containing protein [Ideonella sp.]|uniref:DUF2141 domain-containing protein n=1 Tax=Ideonella sp. TaxID=1929293 RepID=UPI0035B34E6B